MLIFDGRAISNKPSGISNYARGVLRELETHYKPSEVFVLARPGVQLVSKFKVFRVYIPGRIFNILLNQPAFGRLMQKIFNAKVFYSPDMHALSSRIVKSIVTVHDVANLHDQRFHKNGLALEKYKSILRSADVIVCISEFTRTEVIRYGLVDEAEKLVVVHNGFDLFSERSKALKENERIEEKEYLLFVGTFEPRKNIANMIEAFRSSSFYQNGGKLVLVGKYGWDIELNNFIRDQNSISIEVYENASEEVLINLLQHCSSLIYLSLYEGFGLPVAEALGMNKPVITSDIPIMNELFYGLVTLVDPCNLKAIACAIDSISQTEVNNTQDQVVRLYNWRKCASEIRKLL